MKHSICNITKSFTRTGKLLLQRPYYMTASLLSKPFLAESSGHFMQLLLLQTRGFLNFIFKFEYGKYSQFPLLQFNSSVGDRPCIFIGVTYLTFEVKTNLSEIFARLTCKLYVEFLSKCKHKSEC